MRHYWKLGIEGAHRDRPAAEIVAATVMSAGNPADAASAGDLLAADLPTAGAPAVDVPTVQADTEPDQGIETTEATSNESTITQAPLAVYGDAAYGAGALLADLEAAGADILRKVVPPLAPGGRFPRTASRSRPPRAP